MLNLAWPQGRRYAAAMYDPVTEFMRTLASDIRLDEASADKFAALTRRADAEHERAWAETFARHGRLHRAKAITLRAQLGALVEEYGLCLEFTSR